MSHTAQLESRWPHRVAVLLVCAVFPLIWVGGLVTTYKAGMAVPDWPTTFGYNPFAYPLSKWIYGSFDVFVEHGHRLLGALSGIITIALVIVTYRCDSRRWLKIVAAAALVGICLQGVLGGLRVVLRADLVAMIHGCVGPAFFAFCAALVVLSSRSWREVSAQEHPEGARLHVLAFITAALAYVQLLIGAGLRHIPSTASAAEFRALVIFHLGLAAIVALHVVLLAVRIWRRHAGQRLLTFNVSLLCGLVALQLGLGVATWLAKYGWPGSEYTGAAIVNKSMTQSLTVNSHVATGSLIVAFSVVVALWSLRLVKRTPSTARASIRLAGVAT